MNKELYEKANKIKMQINSLENHLETLKAFQKANSFVKIQPTNFGFGNPIILSDYELAVIIASFEEAIAKLTREFESL